MLERSAASLEPCVLPRSLPSSARATRRLHTGFWQHGAAALDLSSLSVWAPPGQGHRDMEEPAPTARQGQGLPDRLAASTFLLDFLYPRGTIAFLRRVTPMLSEQRSSSPNPRQTRPTTTSRLFASSVREPATATKSEGEAKTSLESDDASDQQSSSPTPLDINDNHKAEISPEIDATDTPEADGASLKIAYTTGGQTSYASAGSQPALMRTLIERRDTEFFGPIWQLWMQLDPIEKPALRPEVMAYLDRSASLDSAEKIVVLFSELDETEWTRANLSIVVAATLRQSNVGLAREIYRSGLRNRGIVGGLPQLARHAFQTGDWDFLTRICEERDSYMPGRKDSRWEGEVKPMSYGSLDPVKFVPDLGGRVLELVEYLKLSPLGIREDELEFQRQQNRHSKRSTVREVIRSAAIKALLFQPLKPDEAVPLLRILARAEWYEKYFNRAVSAGQVAYIPELYREFRQLPGCQPRRSTLRRLFDACYPHNVSTIEQIYEDYHTTWGSLDYLAYLKFLKFYAARGDLRSVLRLRDTLIEKYDAKLGVSKTPEIYNHVLHTHTVRGDMEEVHRVFREMRDVHGVEPDVVSWNILLKAHAELDLYGEAIEVWGQLCNAVDPDMTSFGTMMTLSGGRGDLDYTMELFERAKALNIRPNSAMVTGIVQALCQNDRFFEAELACINATKNNISGQWVYLWNRLVDYKVRIRDLKGVYRVLDQMAAHEIEWNTETYELLLHALVNTRETHKARQLLTMAIRKKSFPVAARHFALAMNGALRSRETRLILVLRDEMLAAGIPATAETSPAIVEAEFRRTFQQFERRNREEIHPEEANPIGRELVKDFKKVMLAEEDQAWKDADGDRSRWATGELQQFRVKTRLMKRAVTVLAWFRDLVSVEEIMDLYVSSTPGLSQDDKTLPLPVLEALMQAYVLDGKNDKVKELWEIAWQKALELGRFPAERRAAGTAKRGGVDSDSGSGILPQFAYSLSVPFNALQQVLFQEGEVDRFMAILHRLTGAGFKLHGRNWNFICRALSDSGRWVQACEICEQVLMPNWREWGARRIISDSARNKLPSEVRRLGSAPKHARPNSYLLGELTDEYLRLSHSGLWFAEDRAKITRIKMRCPRMTFVFRSRLRHMNTGEGVTMEPYFDRDVKDEFVAW